MVLPHGMGRVLLAEQFTVRTVCGKGDASLLEYQVQTQQCEPALGTVVDGIATRMVRVLLAEQLYRAHSLLHSHPYCRE